MLRADILSTTLTSGMFTAIETALLTPGCGGLPTRSRSGIRGAIAATPFQPWRHIVK